MPFEINLDKSNRGKLAVQLGLFSAIAFLLMIVDRLFPALAPVLLPAMLLSATLSLLRRGFSAARYALWPLLLICAVLWLLPDPMLRPAAPRMAVRASLPQNADAVRVLQTNVQQVQQTILTFSRRVSEHLFVKRSYLTWAFSLVALAAIVGPLLRKMILKKIPARWFEPGVLFLYELPDQVARYLTAEAISFLMLSLGWWLSLSLLGFPHRYDLALLFGLGSLTPLIGLPWAAGLTSIFLPWKQSGLLAFIGLIISFAVLWLMKYLFLNPLLRSVRPDVRKPVLFACFFTGLVFAGYTGAFFALPLFFLCRRAADISRHAWRMLHPDSQSRQPAAS
ncbi:MAG TPA: AI-2E family transporter [bacterium]|nr:AI-2E family transporter [bacterium]